MATATKQALSGSTNGKQIVVAGTNAAGATTIHTAVTGTGSYDEIWLYAYNDNATSVNLVILWGGTSEPANRIQLLIPAQSGRILVWDGGVLNNGLIVKAYAATASVINIDGFVNNIVSP